MHITPDTPAHAQHVFALQMLFLGLGMLLGLVIIIQYGSPSRRMNADGIYSAAPMYGTSRYPRPVSDFLRSSASAVDRENNAEASEETASSTGPVRHASSSRPIEERLLRREERARQQEERRPSRANRNRDRGGRFSPGWFWR